MRVFREILKPVVAAAILAIGLILPASAGAATVPELLTALREAKAPAEADKVLRELHLAWEKSGSAAMDLLFKRGREALEAEDYGQAIEHFTALTDHAPDFAEGWHGRASAYFHAGLYGPAVADLEQTLALNPDQFEAVQGLAVIFEALDQPKEAYAAYELVLRYHPHHEEAKEALTRLEPLVKGQKL